MQKVVGNETKILKRKWPKFTVRCVTFPIPFIKGTTKLLLKLTLSRFFDRESKTEMASKPKLNKVKT